MTVHFTPGVLSSNVFVSQQQLEWCLPNEVQPSGQFHPYTSQYVRNDMLATQDEEQLGLQGFQIANKTWIVCISKSRHEKLGYFDILLGS